MKLILIRLVLAEFEDKLLVCRERNDGLYSSLTYLVAKFVEEVIVALVQSLIMSCIVFFPLELAGSWALFWYTYFQTTCIGIGECVSSSCDPWQSMQIGVV